jgi:hypothetical protein
MQEDLRSGGEFVARTPEARAGSPFRYYNGFETYLVRDRFDLGRRQQDLEFVDAKVANADAPAERERVSLRSDYSSNGTSQLKALTWQDLPALWLPSLPKPLEYQAVRGLDGG